MMDILYGRDQIPHPSHDMIEWEGGSVTIFATSRFGEIRYCRRCKAEQARTAAGEAMHEELSRPCEVPEWG